MNDRLTEVGVDYYRTAVDLLVAYGMRVLLAVLILLAGYVAAGWASRWVMRICDRSPRVDPALKPILAKVARIAVLVFTGISVLQRFGFETASLIAVIGAAGLTIGLALQGTLSNVAAGAMLLALRPFRPGHAVEIGGKVYIIDEIGLFITFAHLPDGPRVILPNGQIWGNVITNFSVMHNGRRRIVESFSISYDDDMEKAVSLVREALAADERILAEPAPMVAVDKLNDNAVGILVHAWANQGDWFSAKLALTRRVKEMFDANGVTIPFPQREVRLVQAK